MVRHRSLLVRAALLLLLPAAVRPSRAQGPAPPPPPAQTQTRIAGRVIGAVDGRPLAGATVSIAATRSGKLIATAVAGEDGAFAFDGVSAGKYSLTGSARGYLSASYDEHEGFSTAIVTGAGLDTGALVLRLVRGATIAGRVVDEAGDGVRNASIILYGVQPGTGTNRIGRITQAQTDDRGLYEMWPLRPGNYFLAVQATPWYAIHPANDRPGPPGRQFGIDGTVDPALDVAYPLTFYPGATTSDEASPIPVKGGEEVAVDLHLVPQPALRLTFHTGPGGRGTQLMRRVFDDVEYVPAALSSMGEQFEYAGLAPGRFELRQLAKTGIPIGSFTVDLTQSQNVELPPEQAPGLVKLTLAMEDGSALPNQLVQIGLRPANDGRGQPFSVLMANEHGEAEFDELAPGDYTPVVYGPGTLHVARIVQRIGNASRETVRVASGATATATVVLSRAAIEVDGFAKANGKGISGVMVVMVPVGGGAELYRRDQSDLDGSFVLPAAAPGKYIVVAIANGWGLEWGKPATLARYLPRGTPLLVPGTSRGPLSVGTVAVQER